MRDGQGKLEAYPTDAVNYFLYGEATGLIYKDWDKIDAYVKKNTWSLLENQWYWDWVVTPKALFSETHMKTLVYANRIGASAPFLRDGAEGIFAS